MELSHWSQLKLDFVVGGVATWKNKTNWEGLGPKPPWNSRRRFWKKTAPSLNMKIQMGFKGVKGTRKHVAKSLLCEAYSTQKNEGRKEPEMFTSLKKEKSSRFIQLHDFGVIPSLFSFRRIRSKKRFLVPQKRRSLIDSSPIYFQLLRVWGFREGITWLDKWEDVKVFAFTGVVDHPSWFQWLGSPPWIGHGVRPFGRSSTTLDLCLFKVIL